MKIFLAIPLSRQFEDIHIAIRRAVLETDNTLTRMDDYSITNIVEAIKDEIANSDLVIVEMSGKNPSVMYEIGVAQALQIPILPIIQTGEDYLFSLVNIQSLVYERNRVNETLIKRLIEYLSNPKIEEVLKNQIKFSKDKKQKKTVFVSYSHTDREYLYRLKVHLKPFEKKGLIDLWEDTKIKAGEKWKDKIENALDRSAIAILLISADFLASDFIIDNELPPLLKSAEEKGKVILPVILKPCRFTKDENISKFQAVNNPVSPLSKLNENEREEIYVKVADLIEDLI